MAVKLYKRPTSVQTLAAAVPVDPGPPPDPGGVTVLPSGAILGIQRFGSTPHQILSPSSFFNAPIPAGVAVSPETPDVQAELKVQAANGLRPTVGTTSFSLPSYTVNGAFPRVPVKIHTNPVPNYQVASQEILLSPGVPIPPEYVAQSDSDAEALIYCPDTDTAWEFWRLRALATPTDVTWTFGDGSVQTFTCNYECTNFWQITTVSTHLGRSRNHNAGTYPHAPTTVAGRAASENTNMSVAATRIPFLGGLLTVEDVLRARAGIPVSHGLTLTVIHALKEASTAVKFPASTTDGFTSPCAVREGDRYFLDPTVWTDAAIAAANVHPLCRIIMQIARDHGIVVVDKGGSLEIDAEPGVHQFFDGTAPSAILNGFPFPQLQLIGKQTGVDANGKPIIDYGSNATPYPLA